MSKAILGRVLALVFIALGATACANRPGAGEAESFFSTNGLILVLLGGATLFSISDDNDDERPAVGGGRRAAAGFP